MALLVCLLPVAPALAAGDAEAASPGNLVPLWGYVSSGFLWQGAWIAVQITVLAMIAGLVAGLGLALMRLSSLAPLRAISAFYIWVIRGTPLLLQLVFI